MGTTTELKSKLASQNMGDCYQQDGCLDYFVQFSLPKYTELVRAVNHTNYGL